MQVHNVILNNEQREALSWFFNPENKDGEPWSTEEPMKLAVTPDGNLIINDTLLDTEGEWAHPDSEVKVVNTHTFQVEGTVGTSLDADRTNDAIREALEDGLLGSRAMDSTEGPMHELEIDRISVTRQDFSVA